MDTRSIFLAVKDPQILVDITQALGAGWKVTSTASEADALGELEKHSFDAILVDFNFVSPDASELLNQVYEKHPESVRFLLAYEADLALVAAKVEGSPQILPKPIEPAALRTRIESEVKDEIFEPSASAPAPEAPVASVYSDVLKALEEPGITIEQAGDIIAPHTVLALELFKLTNSSYLGLPSDISDPVEAVETLGLETVKAVVRALQFLEESGKCGYLSADKIWEHSITVGQIARDLVLFETKDRALASQALTAGLLHDLGKLVLAKNFEDLYGRVHSLARKQPVALWEIEKEMFGADHGEIGACLIGMWNMPLAIVDAAALHHQPPLGEETQLTPLAAVHVADVLANERSPDDEERMMVAPVISTPLLNQIGLLDRLPLWHARFGSRRSANVVRAQLEAESDATEQSGATIADLASESRTATHLSGPVGRTRTGTSGQSEKREEGPATRPFRYRNNWLIFAAAAAMLLVLLSFVIQPDVQQPEVAYARPLAAQQAKPVENPDTSTEPQVQKAPAAEPETPSTAAASKPADAPDEPAVHQKANAPKEASVPPVSPVSQPVAAIAPAVAPTNVPTPVVTAVVQKPQPQFRLNGIIYTPTLPSAIVNGVTVRVGDYVDGATVVSIAPTRVNLQIEGRRKTLNLR